jgi:hypothetical protein
MKTIDARLRDLEERLKERPRPVCEVCGTEGGAGIVEEFHHDHGVVSFDPREPCPGCERISAAMGYPSRLVVHLHGCWCEADPQRLESAPKVDIADCSDEDFERYASGARKYHRRLQEERKEAKSR